MTAVPMEDLAVYLEEILAAQHAALALFGAFFLYMVLFRRR